MLAGLQAEDPQRAGRNAAKLDTAVFAAQHTICRVITILKKRVYEVDGFPGQACGMCTRMPWRKDAEKFAHHAPQNEYMVQTSRLFGFISAGLRDEDSEAAARNADKVDAALAAARHTIRGANYTIGSQQHFYMEPQVWCHIEHVARKLKPETQNHATTGAKAHHWVAAALSHGVARNASPQNSQVE